MSNFSNVPLPATCALFRLFHKLQYRSPISIVRVCLQAFASTMSHRDWDSHWDFFCKNGGIMIIIYYLYGKIGIRWKLTFRNWISPTLNAVCSLSGNPNKTTNFAQFHCFLYSFIWSCIYQMVISTRQMEISTMLWLRLNDEKIHFCLKSLNGRFSYW